VREAKEELGIDVASTAARAPFGAPSSVAVALFEGQILAGEPQPLHEVDAVGFFHPDAAPEIAFKSTWWALEQWALVQRDRRLRR